MLVLILHVAKSDRINFFRAELKTGYKVYVIFDSY